ncbi:MAG: hypothetical protein DRN07_01160 [Thermoplasmata archaeon]|nr:MAG: hypothetical protein DRN07_01160 [Thermoplasmata archaeon]
MFSCIAIFTCQKLRHAQGKNERACTTSVEHFRTPCHSSSGNVKRRCMAWDAVCHPGLVNVMHSEMDVAKYK